MAPPLLASMRYGAFVAGYTYGAIKLAYLKNAEAKKVEAAHTKADAKPHH